MCACSHSGPRPSLRRSSSRLASGAGDLVWPSSCPGPFLSCMPTLAVSSHPTIVILCIQRDIWTSTEAVHVMLAKLAKTVYYVRRKKGRSTATPLAGIPCIVLRTGSTVYPFVHMCWCHTQIICDTGGMDSVGAHVRFAQAVSGNNCGFTPETAVDPAAFSWFLRDMYVHVYTLATAKGWRCGGGMAVNGLAVWGSDAVANHQAGRPACSGALAIRIRSALEAAFA